MQINFAGQGRARQVASDAKDYFDGIMFQYPQPKVQVQLAGVLGVILSCLRPFKQNDQATVTVNISGDQNGLTTDIHIVTATLP